MIENKLLFKWKNIHLQHFFNVYSMLLTWSHSQITDTEIIYQESLMQQQMKPKCHMSLLSQTYWRKYIWVPLTTQVYLIYILLYHFPFSYTFVLMHHTKAKKWNTHTLYPNHKKLKGETERDGWVVFSWLTRRNAILIETSVHHCLSVWCLTLTLSLNSVRAN